MTTIVGLLLASLTVFEDSESQLGTLQYIQELRRSCSQLTYSVMTTAETAQIELQTEVLQIPLTLSLTSLSFNVLLGLVSMQGKESVTAMNT